MEDVQGGGRKRSIKGEQNMVKEKFHLYKLATLLQQSLQSSIAIPSKAPNMTSPTLIDPRTRFGDLSLELPPPAPFPVLQVDFPTKPDSGETSYKGRGRLTGRRALITGGDSGIGRAVVIAMAREGAKVAINYLPGEALDAEDLAKFLAQEGIEIVRLPGNLLDEAFCEKLIKDAEKALGGLDILVNNAG